MNIHTFSTTRNLEFRKQGQLKQLQCLPKEHLIGLLTSKFPNQFPDIALVVRCDCPAVRLSVVGYFMLEHLRHKPKSSQSTHTTVPISNIGGQFLIQAFEIKKGQSMGENNLVHLNDL